jgi:rSAM/selenodomain-associated transferase 1
MSADLSGVALIIFARFPRRGEVKTRLAETIGSEAAAVFYRLCAEHVFGEIEDLSREVRRFLFYSDRSDENEMQEWAGPQFQLEAQVGTDLGERMENAFRSVFGRGARKAIIIGTDVPDLSAAIIDDAIGALDLCDVVIGPCQDGGYYLLGMKELHTGLFTDIPWSTDEVLEKTLGKVSALHLGIGQLPILADIDTEDDLRHWFEAGSTDDGSPIRASVRSLDLFSTIGEFRNERDSS